jgi:hypothetical protein
MTVKDKAVAMLAAKRIPEKDAAAIIDFAAPKVTGCNWQSSHATQTDLFFQILMREYIKPLALQWVEQNRPDAWYKSMFTP